MDFEAAGRSLEGVVAEGTMISLTYRNNGILTSIIRPPAKELWEMAESILEEDRELFEELKRLGD